MDFKCTILSLVDDVNEVLMILVTQIRRLLDVLGFNLNVAILGGELERVGYEVEQNLLKSLLISADLILLALRQPPFLGITLDECFKVLVFGQHLDAHLL